MASRGIQGDTMTMLAFGAAAVLLWNKVSSAADRAATKVGGVLEIGKNSGGIFQKESTDEINQYEAEVKTWHYNPQGFPKGRTIAYYRTIANKIYVEVKNNLGYTSNIDEDYLINLCKPLNANELRALAVCFGVKDFNNAFGMTSFTGHLFHLFDELLTDSPLGGQDLSKMKTIWAKTGIWL